MINAKATYSEYRLIKSNSAKGKGALDANTAISSPKTLIDTMENFFGLFKPSTKEAILKDVNFEGFKAIVKSKDDMPFDPQKPDFDTPAEIEEGNRMVREYKEKQKIN